MKRYRIAKLQETYISDGSLSQHMDNAKVFMQERDNKRKELLMSIINGVVLLPGKLYDIQIEEGFSPNNWSIGWHTGCAVTISVELSEVRYDEADT